MLTCSYLKKEDSDAFQKQDPFLGLTHNISLGRNELMCQCQMQKNLRKPWTGVAIDILP
jgi:hypothetical protein